MSSASPTSSNRGGRKKTTKSSTARSLSASQIARDPNQFETWSSHHNMDQVLFSDIPDALNQEVDSVMNVKSKIPKGWLDSLKSDHNGPIACRPEFVKFLEDARTACPDLFSDTDKPPPDKFLYDELVTVFGAWKGLREMKASEEKYSEADFAKACDIFRSPAVVLSRKRGQCAVALPQPLSTTNLNSAAIRVLNAKTVIPDNLMLIPRSYIRDLCESEGSPFKVLKGHPAVKEIESAEKGSAFSFQSTPCNTLPSSPGFEFISSIGEDKKPVHPLLEDAYRQNRMSIAAALRHLHSLGIDLPVFGLVWADGTVRAHVDWWKISPEDESQTLRIFSAPYPGPSTGEDDRERTTTSVFHEWRLDDPGHILQVHFLIRNIDHWTCNGFKDIVTAGINKLKKSIVDDRGKYVPWKRVGVLKAVRHPKEPSATTNSSSSPPPKRKPGRPRKSATNSPPPKRKPGRPRK
ncbi:hypothetical protein BDZ89DRAFT_728479 [Hymenopellis radicata]|nr:hypothetical protein BDZ89DRAFT_728479 [Hymenopellis radicata]